MDYSHPWRPNFIRSSVPQVVEEGLDSLPAVNVSELLGRTGETPIAADFVESVSVGVLIESFPD